MTFEHAAQVTEELSHEGITDVCRAACLDGLLRYHNVPETYYRQSAAIFQSGNNETLNRITTDLVDQFAADTTDSYLAYWWDYEDPFELTEYDEFSKPRPEHEWLREYIASYEVRNDSESTSEQLRRGQARQRAGLYVALDNAFHAGKIILGWHGENHVFGIEKETDETHYVLDLVKREDDQRLVRVGPYSLRSICGLPDREPESGFVGLQKRFLHPFRPAHNEDGEIMCFEVFPSERVV